VGLGREGGVGRGCWVGLGVRGGMGMGMTQGGISMQKEREGAESGFRSRRKACHSAYILRGQPSIPPADHVSVLAAPAEAK